MFDTQLNLKLKMGSPKVPEMNGNPEVRGCVSQGQRVYRDWGIYLLAECWAFTTETGVSKDHFLVK